MMEHFDDYLRTEPTPFYLYDKGRIAERANALKAAFPSAHILFSIKANPFPEVVRHLFTLGVGADAASAGEVRLSLDSGASREDIYYSAAGKTKGDLLNAWGSCTLIADSFHELELLDGIAAEKGERAQVGVRVNPQFSMDGGGGGCSKFGIDEEQILENKPAFGRFANLDIIGIHVHLRSQVLSVPTLLGYYQNVYACALAMRDRMGFPIRFINFGGGVGTVYDRARECPLDMEALRAGFAELAHRNASELGARLLVESGRFLLCDAGSYVTEIVDIKCSRGKKYLVVKNGLNGFMRPAVKELLKPHVAEGFAAEPLYTSPDAFPCRILTGETQTERVDLVGHLCTATDVLASDILLPKAKIGDRVVISNAGSYAYALSPLLFSSQEPPRQLLV